MGAIKRIIKGRKFNSKQELKEEIQKIWDEFPQNSIDKLCLSFQSRLRTVINFNGESISNVLRKNLEYDSPIVLSPPSKLLRYDDLITIFDPTVDDQIQKFLSKRDFTTDEDILLLQVTSSFPKRIPWKKISEMFENRTPESLRSRYNYIKK